MHFGLAMLWIIVGIGLLVWHTLDPAVTQGKLGGFSLGWFALVLGVYNLARWWSRRSYLQMRAAERVAEEQRQRSAPRPKPEPDSPFRFDEPTPPGGP